MPSRLRAALGRVLGGGGGHTAAPRRETGPVVLQVGSTACTGPPELRKELWMSALHRADGPAGKASAAFRALLDAGVPATVADAIAKDIRRTFPGTPLDTKALERVLRAYAALDPAVGYCQGLNFLAGLLLLHVPDERASFGLLVTLMMQRGLRALYEDDMAALQGRLCQLQRLLPAEVGAHLEAVGASPALYAAPWFLTLFASDPFPVGVGARLVDTLLCGSPVRAPILAVALAFVRSVSPALLAARDVEAAIRVLRVGLPATPAARLHELVGDALATPWTRAQLSLLDRVDGGGGESVAATVARLDAGGEWVEDEGEAPAASGPVSLSWARPSADGLPASPPGRLPPPPASPAAAVRARMAAQLASAPSDLLSADAAVPPASAAAALLPSLSLGRELRRPPPLPVAVHAAAAASLPPVVGRRPRDGGEGSGEWREFRGADMSGGSGPGTPYAPLSADSALSSAHASTLAAGLESWGPFQRSADGEPGES